MTDTATALRSLFSQNPPYPGNVDVICFGGDVVTEAAVVATLLLVLVREDTQRALYPQVHVLTVEGSGLEAAIRSRCAEELAKLCTDADAAFIERLLEARLRTRSAASLEHDTILAAVDGVPDGSAFIVVGAALFRPARPVELHAEDTGGMTVFGESIRNVAAEDEWSGAIAELAGRLDAPAQNKNLYVPLLAGEPSPVLPENLAKLQGVKGAVFGGRRVVDAEGHVLQQLTRWREMVSGGQEEDAFAEIDAVDMSEINRALVKAQCLLAAQRSTHGFELLRPFLGELREAPPANLVNVARMALHAGEHAESLALLDAALAADPTDEPTLRAIHQHARTMRAEPQQERALELLRRRFPRYTYTLGVEVEASLHRRQYTRILEFLGEYDGQSGVPEYFRYALVLAHGLSASPPWPYYGVIHEVANVAPGSIGKAVLHCARHALDAGEIEMAIQLLAGRGWDGAEAAEMAHVIVRAVERWGRTTPAPTDPEDLRTKYERAFRAILGALPSVFRFLADHPEDADLRAELTNALAPESMGPLGFGVLVHLLKNAEMPTPREVAEPGGTVEAATRERYLDFFKRFFDGWSGKPLVGAPETVSPELRGEDLGALRVRAVDCAVHLATVVGTDPMDKQHLFMHLRVALDLTAHLGPEAATFDLLRVVASARATTGVYQDARDLAENALLMLGARRNVAQKRAAWLVFADAYARCGNLREALLGWLCAAPLWDVELPPSRWGQDVLLYARLLRDVGLHADARAQLQKARALLERSNLDAVARHRVEHLEATILYAQWAGRDGAEAEESDDLDRLADLAARPLAASLSGDDDTYPPAVFAAQVIALHERRGRPVPGALLTAFSAALEAGPPEATARLRVLAGARPDRDELLAMCRTIGTARFSGDLDTDLRQVRLLARRFLDDVGHGADAEGALLAIEILATHAVKPGGAQRTVEEGTLERLRGLTAARALSTTDEREKAGLTSVLARLTTADGPREETTIARLAEAPGVLNELVASLRRNGVAVHALALTSGGRLVRVSSRADGTLLAPVEEEASVFDSTRLESWRKDHPFCYCAPDGRKDRRGTTAYMEESVAGIGTTAEPSADACLYVLAHDLADIPVNLIRVGDDFAGHRGPVALTPSLTWLHTTLQEPGTSARRRTAWFLPPSETLLYPPLAILRDNLGVELARRGFDVISDIDLPSAQRGGELAIVGAHGSIWFDKRMFRAVSDDEKAVQYSMHDFAARLAGTSVVVLLVCSGGRLDRDVLSFGATGLPYELLRRGCRAVVGSPWPLDVFRADQWARHFIDAWDRGETVVAAVHHANEALRRAHPHETHSLAMHVIGNPLERALAVAPVTRPRPTDNLSAEEMASEAPAPQGR